MRTALEIKTQLADELGSNGLPYWRTLSDYLCAKISRQEFEDIVKQYLNLPRLGPCIPHCTLLSPLISQQYNCTMLCS